MSATPITTLNADTLLADIQRLVPNNIERGDFGTDPPRKVDHSSIPAPNITEHELYKILQDRTGGATAKANAQPIPNDAGNLDKQIIRLNNYIQSVTDPKTYLLHKLKELIKVRTEIKNQKTKYISRMLKLGYTEPEAIMLAEQVVRPMKELEIGLYNSLLPDKLTDLALNTTRQTYDDKNLRTGQAMMNQRL